MTEDEALYAKAERLEPRAAIAILEDLIRRKPEHPNALNYAGWLLTAKLGDPTSMARGIQLLQRAVATFPEDGIPLANLAEALLRADQPAEALALIEAALRRSPQWVEALNVSGWLKGLKLGLLDEGIVDLQRAVQLSPWHANANFNLGRALWLKGDRKAALGAFRTSTIRGSWRDHEAYFRSGEGYEEAGLLRRALGAYRQAARLDRGNEFTKELHTAIDRVGNVLLQRGKFFLHAEDEHRFFDYLHREYSPNGLKRVKASSVAADARKLNAQQPAPGLEIIIANMDAKALLPKYADQSPHELVRAGATDVLHDYFAAWVRLYELLLDAEEPETDEPKTTVFKLAAEHKLAEVTALLSGWEQTTEDGILTRAAFGELAGDLAWLFGDKAEARSLYALSEQAFAGYASNASSGSEGLARMADVERVRTKLNPS